MAIYRGTVKGGVVVLAEGVTLAEGSAVEVHVPEEAPEAILARLKAALADRGVRIETKPVIAGVAGPIDRRQIETTGVPVSQLVLESRQ